MWQQISLNQQLADTLQVIKRQILAKGLVGRLKWGWKKGLIVNTHIEPILQFKFS